MRLWTRESVPTHPNRLVIRHPKHAQKDARGQLIAHVNQLLNVPRPWVSSVVRKHIAQAEKGIYHARKAVLLGCVAVGAVFSGDQSSAGAYMQRAQMHLKDCFDSLLPEVGMVFGCSAGGCSSHVPLIVGWLSFCFRATTPLPPPLVFSCVPRPPPSCFLASMLKSHAAPTSLPV